LGRRRKKRGNRSGRSNLPAAATRTVTATPQQPAQASFQTIAMGVSYSGPIPPPEMLRGYEEILPGAMNRILGMAERQESHRHSLESASVLGNLRSQTVGQYIAGIIVVFGMGIGAFLISTGKDVAGFTSMFAPLVGAAGIFVIGRSKQTAERREKLKEVDRPEQ